MEQGKRILLVEDDVDTADLLTQQLERDDYALEVARNGQEAILVTGEFPPELVIVDLMMPKLDGHETSRFLKAKFRNVYMPILVLTAKDDAQSRVKSAKFGCDDYLTKPYKRKTLLTAVEELLKLGRLENKLLEAAVVEERRAAAEAARAAAAEGEPLPTLPEPVDVTGVDSEIVALRLQIAERQVSGGAIELASGHLKRVLEIAPEHDQAQALLGLVRKG